MRHHLFKYGLGLLILCLALPATAAAADDYTATRNPIVLVHGLFGFDRIAGYDYFFGIPDALARGGADVHVVSVSALNDEEVRGEQLLAQVQTILATTGAEQVNLIGHSQGGLSVRYVASVRPDLVSSVTTVGTPHKGSAVADALAGVTRTAPPLAEPVGAVVDGLGTLISVASAHPENSQDSLAALDLLTTDGAARFNTRYPSPALPTDCGQGAAEVDGIRYYSWTGITRLPTNLLDPSATALVATGQLFDGPNDGLVGQCSAHFGRVIRDDYRMDHLDEVNQVAGLVAPIEISPVSLFRQQANRLKNAGL